MSFSIVGDRDPFLLVRLARGESVHTESNAMVSMDANLDLQAQMQGGLLAALGRKFANGESFFNQHITATRGPGEVLLAPTLPGDIQLLDVGPAQYLLNDGAFLAADPSVAMHVRVQGVGQALFGGTGGFFVMETSGTGTLAVSGFGSVFALPVTPESDLLIDNQHVIAWDRNLRYSVGMRTNASKGLLGNLVNSVTSGEGLITRFSGEGKVYLSSRNRANFIEHIGAQLAPRGR